MQVGRNSSIGQQGFGFAISKNKNIKIFHSGRVILQAGVNVGSNCTIDRGSFGDTIIGQNTYFDNLCHVAHNVVVGNNCISHVQGSQERFANPLLCCSISGTFIIWKKWVPTA